MAGYSGTPLAAKLGVRSGSEVMLVGAPPHYRSLLEPLPDAVTFVTEPAASTTLVHLFETRRAPLAKTLGRLRKRLSSEAAVWVSWPKKAARVATDITEDVVRD